MAALDDNRPVRDTDFDQPQASRFRARLGSLGAVAIQFDGHTIFIVDESLTEDRIRVLLQILNIRIEG